MPNSPNAEDDHQPTTFGRINYLLDTNVIIELLRKGSHIQTLKQLGQGAAAISVITYYELCVGIEKSPTAELASKKRTILENVLSQFETIPFLTEDAKNCAKIRAFLESQGKMIGSNDCLIAATSITHQLTLVTNNTKEFLRVPNLKVENWND